MKYRKIRGRSGRTWRRSQRARLRRTRPGAATGCEPLLPERERGREREREPESERERAGERESEPHTLNPKP